MIIDLDKLFEDYLREIVMPQVGKVKPEVLEAQIPDMYEEWKDTPSVDLDGLSPRDYVAKLDDECRLIEIVRECISMDKDIPDMVLMELSKEAYVLDLAELAIEHENFAISLISAIDESGSHKADDILLSMMLDPLRDRDVRDMIGDTLSRGREEIVDKILPLLSEYEDETFDILLDIVSHYIGREEVYEWLVRTFLKGENISLHATYLGQYGDDRAIDVLIDFAKMHTLNYYDFLDIRSAVERLGGEMPEYQYDIVK